MRGIRRVRFYRPGQVQRCGDVPGWQKGGPEAPPPVGAPPARSLPALRVALLSWADGPWGRRHRCLFVCCSYSVTGTLRVLMGALIITEVMVAVVLRWWGGEALSVVLFFARHHLESFIYKSFNFVTVPWGRHGCYLHFITDLNGSAGWWVVIHPGILPGRPGVTLWESSVIPGILFPKEIENWLKHSSLSFKHVTYYLLPF